MGVLQPNRKNHPQIKTNPPSWFGIKPIYTLASDRGNNATDKPSVQDSKNCSCLEVLNSGFA